ncbi:heavy-metal-associated domain-containing protein [Cytophaga aurantiaca]|uniref:heavy-metal-associated domain-containing protein n=1 Tax=Cytophaga aurantiaca TaxID=29530 RepID=UPI00036E5A3B|nr:heavy metal-associated domain-containing protein [Cytophaga aurantiaca]
MKTIIFSTFLAFAGLFHSVTATTTHYETTSFKVNGNCDMCKNRIEGALKKNSGVQSASWDVKTQTVTVVYNPHTISVDQLRQLVADAGHDTDKVKSTDASYKALPGCCKYKRV